MGFNSPLFLLNNLMSEENNPISNVQIDAPTPLISNKPTPLPKLQLFIVFLIQFSEPITGLVVYPLINQLVQETGITKGDERKTGYYAGIIVRFRYIHICIFIHITSYSGISIFLCRMHYSCAVGPFIKSVWAEACPASWSTWFDMFYVFFRFIDYIYPSCNLAIFPRHV